MRRPNNMIIRETYEQNRQVFNDGDRVAARTAWGIYMADINGSGLACEFNHLPTTISSLRSRCERHRRELDQLKFRAKRFEELIALLEKLGDRAAAQLNPLRWEKDDVSETVTRTLDPRAILMYRAFHAALVSYFDELGKDTPDWPKAAELARQVAYMGSTPKSGRRPAFRFPGPESLSSARSASSMPSWKSLRSNPKTDPLQLGPWRTWSPADLAAGILPPRSAGCLLLVLQIP